MNNKKMHKKRLMNWLFVVMFTLQLLLPLGIQASSIVEENGADDSTTSEVQTEETEVKDSDSEESLDPTETVNPAPEEESQSKELTDKPTGEDKANEISQPSQKSEPTNQLNEKSTSESSTEETIKPVDNKQSESINQTTQSIGILQASYTPDANFETIVLQDAQSNNGHTQAKWIWMQGGYLYMAVASTHGIATLSVNGVTASAGTSGEFIDNAHSVVVHAIHEPITIAGFGTHLPQNYVAGNTGDARWSVVRFYNPYVTLNLQPTGNTISSTSEAGGGHNIGSGTTFEVDIPTKSATLNKIWYLGPGGTVDVHLYHSNNDGSTWTRYTQIPVTLTPIQQPDGTFTASYNWSALPYTDTLGRRLIYKAEEVNPGPNYEPEMTTEFDPVTNHYTFTLINTYSVPKITLSVMKEWVGGPSSNHVPVEIELWRTTDNITVEEVVGIDPIITPDPGEYQTSSSYNYVWEDLPEETDSGVPYTYYFTETESDSDNYEKTYGSSYTIGGIMYGVFVASQGKVVNTYNIPKTDVTATKHWVNGETVRPDLWFQLRRKSTVDGVEVDEEVEIMKLPVTGDTVTVNFTDVNQTDFNGNIYRYYVVEGQYDVENGVFTEQVPQNFEQKKSENELELTNTYVIPKNATATATKKWIGSEVEKHFEVEFTLWKTTNNIDFEMVDIEPTITNSADGLVYDYTWLNLEETNSAGIPYLYYFTEEDIPEGFKRIYSGEAIEVNGTMYEPSGGTIVNQQMTIDFAFTKVDEEGKELIGSEFELIRENDMTSIINTGQDPKFIFEDLTEGNYVLRETKVPAGYKLPTKSWIIQVVRNESTGVLEIIIPDDSFLSITDEGYLFRNEGEGAFPQTGGIGALTYLGAGVTVLLTSMGLYIKKNENNGGKRK